MRVKVIGVLMLIGISLAQAARSSPMRQPGPCTSYGCMYLTQMSQVGANYSQGCVQFNDVNVHTGRKVRNNSGFQGGDPSTLGGTQDIFYSYQDPCNACQPPALNSIAVEGAPIFVFGTLGTFGRYECDNFADPNPPGGLNPVGPPF